MRARPAIEVALDLKAAPSLVRKARRQPLPPEIKQVLCVAAGSKEITEALAVRYRKSDVHIREACLFFLHQVVLFYGADSYRTLGLGSDATAAQIKEHKRWLLMWLHPDRNPDKWESALFQRVVMATKTIGKDLPPPSKYSRVSHKYKLRGLSVAQMEKSSKRLDPRVGVKANRVRLVWLSVLFASIVILFLLQRFSFF